MSVATLSNRRALRLGTALVSTLAALGFAQGAQAQGLPDAAPGGIPGAVDISTTATSMEIDIRNANRVLDWTSFNIDAGNAVSFVSSSGNGNNRTFDLTTAYGVLNRVNAANPVTIAGSITSQDNISVWLMSPGGVTFGNGASFSGGSLVVTTLNTLSTSFGNVVGGNAFTLSGTSAAGITVENGASLTPGGDFIIVAQDIQIDGTLTAGRIAPATPKAGSVALIAARNVNFPLGVASPLSFTIGAGTTVGNLEVSATGRVTGDSVSLAAQTEQAGLANLLRADTGSVLTARAVNGVVTLTAATSGAGTPPAAGTAQLAADGAIGAGTGGISITTSNAAAANGGEIAVGGALTTTGNIAIESQSGTAARGAVLNTGTVSAGGNYTVTGSSVNLGTGAKSAAGEVLVESTVGDITGAAGLAITSNTANDSTGETDNYIDLRSAGSINLGTGSLSTTTLFQPGVGLTTGAGGTVTVGNVTGRQIGQFDAAHTTFSTYTGTGDATFGDVNLSAGFDISAAGFAVTAGDITASRVSVTAASLTVGDVTTDGTDGTTLTGALQAGDWNTTNNAVLSAGSITLDSFTGGTGDSSLTATAGDIDVDTVSVAGLATINATGAVSGRTNANLASGTTASGSFDIDAGTTANVGGLNATGNIDIDAVGALTLGSATSTGGFVQATGSTVTLGATAALAAANEVLIQATAGDITGGGASASIASNTGTTSGAANVNYLDLRTTGSISLGATSLSTTNQIAGVGLTTGAGGTVTVGNVTGRQIGQFDAAHTTFSSYTATGDATFGNVNLSAGFDISAAGFAVTAGDITASRVSVTAASLTVGDVTTDGTDGTTLTGALQAGDWNTTNNAVLSAGSITLDSFTGGSGDSSLTATAGDIDVDTVSVAGLATINATGTVSGRTSANLASGTTASGSFDIDAGTTANVGGLNATGNIDIDAVGALTLGSASSTNGFVQASGSTVTLGATAAISAADEVLIVSNTGAITGGGTGASITSNTGGGATATTNYIDLRSAAAISLAGTALTVTGQGSSVGLSTPAGVNITVGNVTASSLVQFNAAHTTATSFVSNDSLTTGNLDLITGTLTLLNASSNLVTGAFDADTINVNVGGTITSGAVTAAGTTSLVGGGLVTLASLANSGAGATTTVRSTGTGVTVTGATSSDGALTVEGEGGSLSLQAVTVNGAGNVLSLRAAGATSDIGATALRSNGGDIRVNAGRDVSIASATTSLTATASQGSIGLLAGRDITATGVLRAGEDIIARSVRDATFNSLVSNDDILIQAERNLNVSLASTLGGGADTRGPGSYALPGILGEAGFSGVESFSGSQIVFFGSNVNSNVAPTDTGLVLGSALTTVTADAASVLAQTGDIRIGNLTADAGTLGVTATLGSVTGREASPVALSGGAAILAAGSFTVASTGDVNLGSVSVDSINATSSSTLRVQSLTTNAGGATLRANGLLRVDGGNVAGTLSATTTGGTAGIFNPLANPLAPGFGEANLTASAATGAITVTANNGVAKLGRLAAGNGTAFVGNQINVDAGAVSIDSLLAAGNVTVDAVTTNILTGNFTGSGTGGVFESTLGNITLTTLNGSVIGKGQAAYDITAAGGAGVASYESFGALSLDSDGDVATNSLTAAGNITLNIDGQLHGRTVTTPADVAGARLVTGSAASNISVTGNAGAGRINLAAAESAGTVNLSASQVAVGLVQVGGVGSVTTTGTSYFGRLRSTGDLALTFTGQPIGSTNVFATEQFSGTTPASEFFVAGFGNTNITSNGGSVSGTIGLGAEIGTLQVANGIGLTVGGLVVDSLIAFGTTGIDISATSGTLSLLSAQTEGPVLLEKLGTATNAGNDLRVLSGNLAQDMPTSADINVNLQSATSVRLGNLTAAHGSMSVIASAGDVTGWAAGAVPAAALGVRASTSAVLSASYGAANLTVADGATARMDITATAPVGPVGGVLQFGTLASDGRMDLIAAAITGSSATATNGSVTARSNAGMLSIDTITAGTFVSLAKLGNLAVAGDELRFDTALASTAPTGFNTLIAASATDIRGTSATVRGGSISLFAGHEAGAPVREGNISGLTPGSGITLRAQDNLGTFTTAAQGGGILATAGGDITLAETRAASLVTIAAGDSAAGLSGSVRLLQGARSDNSSVNVFSRNISANPLDRTGIDFSGQTVNAASGVQLITSGLNGGSITGGTVLAGSQVQIDSAANLAIGSLDAGLTSPALGNVAVRAAGSVTGSDWSSAAATAIVAGGSVSLTDVSAGSDLDIRSNGVQSGTAFSIDIGTASAGDDLSLTAASVRVGTATTTGAGADGSDANLGGLTNLAVAVGGGNAGAVPALTGGTVRTGSQMAITATSFGLELGTGSAAGTATLTKQGGGQVLDADEIRVLTSLTAGTGATVTSSTDVRAARLTATTGNLAVTATAGDVTGIAVGATAPVSARVTTGTALTSAFGAADLTAATGNITVNAGGATATTGGVAQLDAVTALAGNITIDAEAVAIAPVAPDELRAGGNLSVTARSGTLVLSNATAGRNITLTKQGVATPDGTLASVAAGDEVRFVNLDAGAAASGNTIGITSATSVLGDSATVRGGSISIEAGKVGAAIVNAGQVGGFTPGNELSLFALADDATLNLASPLTGTVSVRAGGRIGLATVQALDTIAASAGGTGAGLAGQIAIAGDIESARGDISLASRNSVAASATGISFSQTLDAARDVTFLTGGSNGGGVGGTAVLAGRDVLADVIGGIGINTVDVVRNAALRSLGAVSLSTITADGSIGIVAGNAAVAANPLVTTPWIDIGTAEAGVDVDMRALGPQNGTTPSVRILTRVTGGDDVSLTGSSVRAVLAQALGTASDVADANLAGTVAIADPLDAGFTGTVPALTGGTARPGGQLAITAESFSLELGTGTAAGRATLTKQGGGQVLDGDEIRVLTSLTGGTAGTSAGSDSVVVRSSTDVRAAQLTATSGNILVDATAGDVTGLATGATTPGSGRVTTGTALTTAFGAANLTATADSGTILVNVTAPDATNGGVAQLGTVTAGATVTVNAEAAAIDSATARLGDLGDIAVTARSGTLSLNTGTAADDISLTKLGSIAGAGNELRFNTLAASQDSNPAFQGDITLTSSGNVIGTSATARGGAIAIRAGDVGGTITNAGNVAGNTAAGLVLSAQDNAGTFLTSSPLTSSISVRAGGSATLGAIDAVDSIAVSTGGATAALAGSMRLLAAASSARGDIVLGNRNSAAPSATGIQFTTLTAARDVTILTAPISNGGGAAGSSILAGRDVNVDAGAINVGVVNAGRNIAMRANGAITGTDWDAGGAATLLAQTNGGYVTLGTIDAGSDIDVQANGVQAGTTPSISIGTAQARDDIGLMASSVQVGVAQAGVAPGGNDTGDANLAGLTSILDGVDPAFTGAVPAASGGTARTGGASLAISASDGNVTVNTRAEATRDVLIDATGTVAIPNGVAGRSLGISAGGSVGSAATTLTAAEDLAIRAGTTVNAATLQAGDDLAVTATGAIAVSQVNVTGIGGTATSVTFAATAPKVSVGTSTANSTNLAITSANAGITLGAVDVDSPGVATATIDASANGLVTISRSLAVEGNAAILADDGVVLGDGATPGRSFSTEGSLTILADTGNVTGNGPIVLTSDSDGTGAAGPLSITATTGNIALGGASLAGGPARQSAVTLSAVAGAITLATASGESITANAATGFTATGALTAGNTVRPADGATPTLGITVTGGNIQLADATTTGSGHDLRLTASGNVAGNALVSARDVLVDAGGTLGLASASAARSIGAIVGGNVGSAPMVLTAGEDIAVRSGGSVTAATLTAGDDLALTAANGIAVDSTVLTGAGGDTTSVTFTTAAPRVAVAASTADSSVLSMVSTGGDIALGAVDVDSPGVASATIDASAAGMVTIARNFAVEGNGSILADKGVTLGDGATPGRSYSTEGSLTILADTGNVTGNGPIVLTSDSDGTGAAGPLSITATTGNIALGGASLAGGTARQSSVALSAVQGSIALATASGAAINATARIGFTATGALNAGNTTRPADGTTPTLGITVTNGNIALADATATGTGHDLKLAASGSVTTTDLAAGRDIAIGGATAGSSAASAAIRAASAGQNYTVLSTGDVTLGDAAARSHVAGGAVTITSASGRVGQGAGALILSSNTDGTGAEALAVSGNTGVALTNATITGGTAANRSAVSLVSATGPVTGQVVTGSTVLLDASAAGSVTATTVAGSGAVTAKAKTTAALGTVDAGGALTVEAGGNATLGTATAGGASTLTSGGTLTLGKLTSGGDVAITATTGTVLQSGGTNGITAVGRAVTIRTADATIGSDITAASIRATNTGTSRMVVGDLSSPDGFVLDAAEANRLKAATIVLDAGSAATNNLAVGTLNLSTNAPLTALYLNAAQRVDVTGTITLGNPVTTLQIGGATNAALATSGRAKVIAIASTADAGGRIFAPNANVTLRGDSIGFGQTTGFLGALGLTSGGTPDLNSALLMNANGASALYSPVNGGGALYSNPVLLQARSLTVRYTGFALLQNTGSPSLPTGSVLNTLTGTGGPALQLFGEGTAQAGSFGIFGTINGVQGSAASLLGALATPVVNVDPTGARINGCLIGSGSGCVASLVAPPSLGSIAPQIGNLLDTNSDFEIPFDPLVGTNNDSLFGDVGTFGLGDVDLAPIECSDPNDTTCEAPQQGETR